jgi:tRNA dimethylallyltransferase
VGKTQVALQLAESLRGEIVSVDSRLFYRGMDIGTAKPSPEERLRVRHHLIDIADPDDNMSLASFQGLAHAAIAEIFAIGRLPILVGGTGQYVRAVRAGWRPPRVPPNPGLRNELTRLASVRGGFWLHEKLASLDPPASEKIDFRNIRRTVRALEVILTTGVKFSDQRGSGNSSYRFITIGLRRDRDDLYARIDARIDTMLAGGLLDETRQLLERGYSPDLPAFSAIGYLECAGVVVGQIDVEAARLQMRRSTRALVRRQSNWFRETDPTIQWFDAARQDVVEAITTTIQDALATATHTPRGSA